ncbi:hypothetical protein LTR62_008194 [Meristemomyces frigidus]|uniref:FAS1 domain-containing protein n=1 Tax=Meristemomyces frigidus TaxID=1508187 RepID=A0AAN7T9Y8_9PEZI|nr:hypothetical protein LTR62_008194 [Meristemomyces frigidus]
MPALIPRVLLTLAACKLVAAAPSLTDILSNHANLTQLNNLLMNQSSDFLKSLQGQTDITFLAPNDHAFLGIPDTDVLAPAFQNKDYAGDITNILKYHVLPGQHPSSSLSRNGSFQFLPTLLTDGNWSDVTGGQRIGAVLQGDDPPLMVFTSGLSTRSAVTEQDVDFEGGIIQIIDNFAIPPMPFVYTVDQYNLAFEAQGMLSFLGAVYSIPPINATTASLPRYLNETRDLTLFVPSNLALEYVSGTLETLSPAALNDILSYHILGPNTGGPIYSSDFINQTQLPTLQGSNITLTFTSNSYFVNSARVIAADILIKNGVMHVLDNVLSPNHTGIRGLNATTYTQAPVLPTTFPAGQALNSSAAPYTTFVPDFYVSVSSISDVVVQTETTAGGGGGQSTAFATASSTGKHKKSAAGSLCHGAEGSGWLGANMGVAVVVTVAGGVFLL